MGDRHQGGAPGAPNLEEHRPALAEFLAEDRHYRPTGHLMTLHEVNVAFSDGLKAATEGLVVVPGLAAKMLKRMDPELRERMHLLAPMGGRLKGWRKSV